MTTFHFVFISFHQYTLSDFRAILRLLYHCTPYTHHLEHAEHKQQSRMSAPINIPARGEATSPPIDPSKLNNQPAVIPVSPEGKEMAQPVDPSPLRSPEGPDGGGSSAYLDTNTNTEPASHPTVAETGSLLATSPSGGGGPRKGQLRKVEGGEKKDGIISLGSFGGEGLAAKPSRSPSISQQGAQAESGHALDQDNKA